MNADASKFSLTAESQRIKPLLEYLIFKRVPDYFLKEEITCAGRKRCLFEIRKDSLLVPFGFTDNTYLRVVARCNHLAYDCMHDLTQAKEVRKNLLFLNREGDWFLWRTIFVNQGKCTLRGKYIFLSQESVIRKTNDETVLVASHDADLASCVREEIDRWLIECIERRERVSGRFAELLKESPLFQAKVNG